jgi:hypothetical protein
LIQPKTFENFWTLKGFVKLMQKKGNFPPISTATLAALTPNDFEVVIIDENIETINFEIECDLVGITGYTVHSRRMFEISSEFRKKGVLTVVGGVYCSAYHYRGACLISSLSPIGIKRPCLFLELRRLCETKFLMTIILKRDFICFNETSNSVASLKLLRI